MRKPLVLALALFLGGCAAFSGTVTPEAQVFVACRSFVDTEKALRPFKRVMSPGQTAIMKRAIVVAKPLCTDGGLPNATDARVVLDIIRSQLREMLTIQLEIKS